MSTKQVSLKSPVTIVVVMVLLVGVVFLNLNTFGDQSGKTSRGYRVQAHPPVPMDALQLASCESGLPDPGTQRASAQSLGKLERDPFHPDVVMQKTTMSAPGKKSKPATKRRSKTKPLECSAIMLGGIQPMAIINGEGRHPGDKIRGMILTAIDADGVTFRKTNGKYVHLPVGVQEDENPSFRVITQAPKTDEQGRTRLVDQ